MFEIGPALRQARDRRRLGLDQAEAETKVRARYLHALEDEDFDLLPGPTYVKGFLRTYADYLGLNGQLFVDEYNSRFVDPRHEDELLFPRRRSLPPRQRRSRRERDLILITLAAIVALVVIVAVGWKFSAGQTAAPLPPPPPTGATSTHARLVNEQIPAARDNRRHATQAAKAAAARRKPVRLVARVTSASYWVAIWEGQSSAGRKLFDDTVALGGATGGKTPILRSAKGFTLQLGYANQVQLVVNGHQYFLGPKLAYHVTPDGKVRPA